MLTIYKLLKAIFSSDGIPDAALHLEKQGVTFTIHPWSISASFPISNAGDTNKVITQNLTASATSLMKGSVSSLALEQVRFAIKGFLNEVWEAYAPPAVPKPAAIGVADILIIPSSDGYSLVLTGVGTSPIATINTIRAITGCTLAEANDSITKLPSLLLVGESEQVVHFAAAALNSGHATTTIVLPKSPLSLYGKPHLHSPKALPVEQWGDNLIPVPPPAPEVYFVSDSPFAPMATFTYDPDAAKMAKAIPLAEAKALGQPVQGTDHDSRYYVIALNERLRVAARIREADKSLSFRVETAPGKNTGHGEKAMLDSILENKGDYWSLHTSYDTVPPSRIIGAFLLGSGIDFDQQVRKQKELVIT